MFKNFHFPFLTSISLGSGLDLSPYLALYLPSVITTIRHRALETSATVECSTKTVCFRLFHRGHLVQRCQSCELAHLHNLPAAL